MKKRCLNPNCKRYKDYGGRGITICNAWLSGFDDFADWAYQNGYEQAYNKRQSIIVEYRGERRDLMIWCNELGLKYDTINHRITHGWSAKDAFEKPTDNKSFAQICRENGINPVTAYDRIHKLGWSFERAISVKPRGKGTNQKTYSEVS